MIDEGGLTSLATLERETMERHKQEHVRAVEEALRPHSSRQAELVAKQGQRLKDLQAQVSELLRFKEETFNQRAEMSVLQGKLREKESEARTMQNSIQDILSRTDDVHLKLHDKCARLERQRDTFAKQAGDHEHDLLAHIEALQQDNKRQAETNGILQQKLSAAEREAQHQLSHGKSSTQRLDSLLADVKAENETLRQQLAASEATARNEESSSRQVSEEPSRQQKVITQLTTEISDLRAFHNEQRSLIGIFYWAFS
ncbi:hypothetical protein DIPPA_09920 [Diplonema papillatum]|nr:hypothetical protein DIPPA_09920 [Diplonema papillatum]